MSRLCRVSLCAALVLLGVGAGCDGKSKSTSSADTAKPHGIRAWPH